MKVDIKNVEDYFWDLNLNRYDLGGVEFVEEDFETILNRIHLEIEKLTKENRSFNINEILEEKVAEYLYEIREILDEGLEDVEEDLDDF